MNNLTNLVILFFIISAAVNVSAQKAKIYVEQVTLKTYPFSDPNPVPETGAIYPYFKFEGYTVKGADKKWKMVVLENDYIKVFVAPEVGGKVWGAIEKSTGKEFVYFNHSAKFREVAMRGAWTSGGVEFNFGKIGHAPTCSTPVDYTTRQNKDGSVSCFIGATDLTSGTNWRVEINLPKDKAYFTTKCWWHNPSGLEQSYYHWTNGGFKASGNLEFIFPGDYRIGHGGEVGKWPVDEHGRDLRFYENNNFGGPKSYHILGGNTGFYGGYWHDDNFGTAHWSEYDEKPGQKIWIWGLSRQGMIWENLLTDSDGQYVELQSGRLFNQAASKSSKSPFKHRGFPPGSTDVWTEYWFPVKETGGFNAASPYAVANVIEQNGSLSVRLCAISPLNDTLRLFRGSKEIWSENLALKPMEKFEGLIDTKGEAPLRLVLGDNLLEWEQGSLHKKLSRPVESPPDFDWGSTYGLYTQGREFVKQRLYKEAWAAIQKCLKKDAYFLPAISLKAELLYRKAEYPKALEAAIKGLSIDTYDPHSNYIYGLVSEEMGNVNDAIDGFSIATASVKYRPASYLKLAQIYLVEKKYNRAKHYAEECLAYNANNQEAKEVLVLTGRKTNDTGFAKQQIEGLLSNDPLCHSALFEAFLLTGNQDELMALKQSVQNEFPHETYLGLAVKYANYMMYEEALKVLSLPDENATIDFWKAYLYHKMNENEVAQEYLGKAVSLSPEMVFPHRIESKEVLEWALKENPHWKIKYYLALIESSIGNEEKAGELLATCAGEPDFSPFYLMRAKNTKPGLVQNDLELAVKYNSAGWRPRYRLGNYFFKKNNFKQSNKISQELINEFPENFPVNILYAKSLIALGEYSKAISFLKGAILIPKEGSTEGRRLYRKACIREAMEKMGEGNYSVAIKNLIQSKNWPENLGAGKPYSPDERIEDFLLAYCYRAKGDSNKMKSAYSRIASRVDREDYKPSGSVDLLSALVLRQTGEKEKGAAVIKQLLDQTKQHKSARWSEAIYNGDFIAAEKIRLEKAIVKESNPYESYFNDPEFETVVECYNRFWK
ncbi:MAG: DUF5107 domain-containing protein [Chlorobi bacterium]|nr:DUF5107 domain-containing protein [Chlorobiota bacterium]